MNVDDTKVQDPNLPKVDHAFHRGTPLREIYDYVLSFMERQGGPSVGEDGARCLYVAPSGRRCAAGCLVRDEDVARKLNSLGSIRSFLDQQDVDDAFGWNLTTAQFDLVVRLQENHDGASRDGGKFFPMFEMRARMSALGMVEREELVAQSNGPRVLR